MSSQRVESSELSPFVTLLDACRSELEGIRRELGEIDITIQQSQTEVNRLTQRNATATIQLQQLQSHLDSMPRADIRTAYDTALDAQQRLFVMRGQLDKLQSDKNHLLRYQTLLERVLGVMKDLPQQTTVKKGFTATSETVEMMIQAQEAERQRLARKMHDGPAQALSNFILQTDIAVRFFDKDQAKAKEELDGLKIAASATFHKVRDFIFELRPMMLDDLGLLPTLNRYVESFKDQSGLEVRFTSSGMDQRLEPYIEVMLFRAVQELLSNAARHSQCSLVKLQIDYAAGEVRVSVDDNGKGYDTGSISESGGMGLKVIRDRVEMIGGEMEIDSVIGQGTRVVFTIPAKTAGKFA